MKRISTGCILIACAVFLLPASCKQKDKPQYFPITEQRIKDAMKFKVGSYFIYQDSATQRIDSYWVATYHEAISEDPGDHSYVEDVYQYNLITTTPKKEVKVAAFGRLGNKITGEFNDYSASVHLTMNYMLLPFTVGEIRTVGVAKEYQVNYYPSVQISGNSYADVYEVRYVSDAGDYLMATMYSGTSGLIKFTAMYNGEYHVWTVLRSYLVR